MKKVLLLVLVALTSLFFVGLNTVSAAEEGTWTLVTDASTLAVGDQVVIVAKDSNYALSTNQKKSNRGQASVTKTNDTVTFGSDVQILTLKAGSSAGTFALYTGSVYLYAASSSSNHLKTQATNNANGSWNITIASTGVATIKASGSNSRNVMQYNKASSLFACYASASQQAIVVYKFVEANSGDSGETPDEPETPVIEYIEATTIKALFNEYYHSGVYTRKTHISLATTNDEVKADFYQYFHNAKNGINVFADRTTQFVDDYLYFEETKVGFGTGANGELTSFTWDGEYEHSEHKTNAIEEKFITIHDFISLNSQWFVEGEYFVNTSAEVIAAAVAFTAPGWQAPANYMTYTRVTVKEYNGELIIGLWVNKEADGVKLVSDCKTSTDGTHALFSEAKISVDRNVSIVEALAIGKVYAHNTYAAEKYTVTGVIKEVYNTTYGNLYLEDAAGNQITVYGLYSADGKTRYDAMSDKPVVGDTITIVGELGNYNNAAQFKNGWLLSHTAHEHDYSDATCTEPATCSICKGTDGEPLGHKDEVKDHSCDVCGDVVSACLDANTDGKCDVCGASVSGEKEPVTATKTIKELITEYGWTSNTTKQSFNLDDKVSVKVNGGSNTGKAYNGDHIRIYASDSPAGTLTISVPEGYELVSIKITTQTGTYAYLNIDGVSGDISNKTIEVSGNSVVVKSVINGTNGKQARITAIEVIYK